MSLSSVQSPVSSQLAAPVMNEMQREDFLALASALRQFNAYESEITCSATSVGRAENAE
jgi:hypothetical protein